ncbi:MAG: hypothetical protein JWM11_5820 [Planctomycetaceae bacterium]|nr:hypothetical protein [Planctomycetaceae bacterium]
MLSLKLRENYERIQTWGGEYRVSVARGLPGGLSKEQIDSADTDKPKQDRGPTITDMIKSETAAGPRHWQFERGVVSFSTNLPQQKYHAVYSTDQPIEGLDVESGAEILIKRPTSPIHWIITSDDGYEFDTQKTVRQLPQFPIVQSVPLNGGRILYRKSPRKASFHQSFLDVRVLFEGTRSRFAQGPWKHSDLVIKSLRANSENQDLPAGERQMDLYISSEVPPVYTEVTSGAKTNSRQVYQYDGKVGFHVVVNSLVASTNAVDAREETKTSYRNIEGIFIPVEIERLSHQVSVQKNNLKTLHQSCDHYSLVRTELNKPLAAAEFGLEQLGLKYGERMLDEIKSTLHVYDDKAGFIPVEKFELDPSRQPLPE